MEKAFSNSVREHNALSLSIGMHIRSKQLVKIFVAVHSLVYSRQQHTRRVMSREAVFVREFAVVQFVRDEI